MKTWLYLPLPFLLSSCTQSNSKPIESNVNKIKVEEKGEDLRPLQLECFTEDENRILQLASAVYFCNDLSNLIKQSSKREMTEFLNLKNNSKVVIIVFRYDLSLEPDALMVHWSKEDIEEIVKKRGYNVVFMELDAPKPAYDHEQYALWSEKRPETLRADAYLNMQLKKERKKFIGEMNF